MENIETNVGPCMISIVIICMIRHQTLEELSKYCVIITKEREAPNGASLSLLYIRIKSIFLPRLDLDILFIHFAEGIDEGTCQTGVGNQRNVVVDGTTTNLVTVGQFALGVVLRDVYDEVELVFGNHLHHVVFCIRAFIRPEYRSRAYAVSVQEGSGT